MIALPWVPVYGKCPLQRSTELHTSPEGDDMKTYVSYTRRFDSFDLIIEMLKK